MDCRGAAVRRLRMEHRWGQRIAMDVPVRFTWTGSSLVSIGRLVNVSLSGGFLAIHSELRPLSRIEISLDSPLRTRRPTPAVEAYVARSSATGVGLEWCTFAHPTVVELLRPSHDIRPPGGVERDRRRSFAPANPLPHDPDIMKR